MPFHVWPAPQYGGKSGEESAAIGYAAGLAAWFLLAGVYVAAKFGIAELPPWLLAFWRLVIATLALLPFVWSERAAMVAFLRKRWLEAFVIGALGLGITQGVIYTALLYTSAINVGIVNSISPIITLILAKIFLREPMGGWQYLGSAIAFAGIVVTTVHGSLTILLGLRFGFGDLLVLIGATTLAVYTVLLKRAKFELARLPLLVVLLTGAVISTIPGVLFEVMTGQHTDLALKGYLALAYAAIPGGALLYLFYNWSIGILGAARAGTLMYSSMVFTALLAWLILGETIEWYHVVGAVLIVVGVAFVELMKAESNRHGPQARGI